MTSSLCSLHSHLPLPSTSRSQVCFSLWSPESPRTEHCLFSHGYTNTILMLLLFTKSLAQFVFPFPLSLEIFATCLGWSHLFNDSSGLFFTFSTTSREKLCGSLLPFHFFSLSKAYSQPILLINWLFLDLASQFRSSGTRHSVFLHMFYHIFLFACSLAKLIVN